MTLPAPETHESPGSAAVEVIVERLDRASGVSRELLPLLSRDERERADRFVFDLHRRRYILGRVRLRQLLALRLDVAPRAIEFEYGAQGKPALAPAFAECGLRFNVSHCEDVAVYAFACGREVGIDVEAVRELSDADSIAARFFSLREYAAYQSLAPRDRPLGFFNCWTQKEAFIKAIGEGLSHPLDSFDVSLVPGEPARILRVGGESGNDIGWLAQRFHPAPGFVGSIVAARDEGRPVAVPEIACRPMSACAP
jgi:4'-phosphopantetheinyl transferase